MKIELSEKEFRRMLDMIYIGNWILNSTRGDDFWESGGCCCRSNDYTSSHDEWKINYDDIPAKFKKYAYEIDEVFNENVEHRCCGGCA